MTPSRSTLLRSQLFFAYVTAIPLTTLLLISIPAIGDAPYIPLSFLGCAIIGNLLCQHWRRAIATGSMARGEHIASIALWAVPFLASLATMTAIVMAELDDHPDIFNDVGIRPIAFIGLPIVGLLWFGIPLICSILLARMDSRTTISQALAS